MEEAELVKLMDLFSYQRYELPNNRNDVSYIYPVIMPLEDCDRQRAACKREFFCQEMYPLMESTDIGEYDMEDILTNLAVGTHGLTKYEIDSPYKFHRPVPSARGIHPCELYFFSRRGVKRYNPTDNFFDVLCERDEEKIDEFSIVVAADDWRLAKFYGDFAYVLGALDAGHIIGQLAVLSAKCGCCMEVIYSKAQVIGNTNVASYFKEQGLNVYASVLIKKESKKDKGSVSYQMRGKRRVSYPKKLNQLGYRKTLYNLKKIELACDTPDRMVLPAHLKRQPVGKKETETIGRILRERTSAHSHIGLMSVGQVKDVYKKLLWIAKELKEYMQKVNLFPYMNVYLFLNQECKQLEKGYYRLKDEQEWWKLINRTENVREEWFRIIHDSHEFLNVQGIPFVFLFSVNIQQIIEMYGDRAIDAMYMYSGEIAQILSLLVTKFGWFSRPIKNICEDKLEDFLKIHRNCERITYAMLIGRENISQQKLEMNPFGDWEDVN